MNPMVVGAGIAGIAGIGGGILGNKASAEEAARNRRFQKHMYRRRYQYTVEDMRKAGLNPALAYQQGGGSSPSGSMASQDDPIKGGVEGATRAITSALAVRQNRATIENIEAQTRKTDAERRQLEAESAARAGWWQGRPELQSMQTLESGMRWRVQNLTREFLDQTMKDRISIAGYEREEMEAILQRMALEYKLRKMDEAPLAAQEKFAKSWFGENVAPGVSSAGGAVGALMGIITPFLRFLSNERGRESRSEPEGRQGKGYIPSRRRY